MAILFPRIPSLPYFSFIFLLLLSIFFPWAASTTPPKPSTQETITVACQILRAHGYSFFAGILKTSAGKLDWNITGTIFAPSDLAFARKFRTSTSLFLYHTIQEPLRWEDLQSRSDGAGFATLFRQRCLFLCRNPAGELCVSTTNNNPATSSARIRHPNLYLGDKLYVHGIDGILNPIVASPCNPSAIGFSVPSPAPGLSMTPYLNHAIRALRRSGYSVLATTMSIRRNEITALPTVTVFFPIDGVVLGGREGLRYDFRYHVVPHRLPFTDLARLPSGTRINTLLTGKSLVVNSDDGAVKLNGISLNRPGIYHNSWIVIHVIPRPFQISDSFDGSVISETPRRGNQLPGDNGKAAITPAIGGNSSGDSADGTMAPTSVGDQVDRRHGLQSSGNLQVSAYVASETPSPSPLAGGGVSEIKNSGPTNCTRKNAESPALSPGNQDSGRLNGAGLTPSGWGQESCDDGLRNLTAVGASVTVLAPAAAPVTGITAKVHQNATTAVFWEA